MRKKKAKKQKIIVIVGQTSSGKSDLAVEIAREFNGEVISADSRQVYKGLDIGTGKITKREMRSVPHHLLDVVSLRKRFTAYDFVSLAHKAINDIVAREKLPIIAGGTMFYIDALLGKVHISQVPPNQALHAKLEQQGLDSLLTQIKKLNGARADALERDGQNKNKRRIIRAIEIAISRESSECPKEAFKHLQEHNVLKIGIIIQKKELREKIKLRTAKRIRKGMLAEAKKLHNNGLSYKRMRGLGLEYKHLADYLQNKITKDELTWRIERDDWHYARKQMSWWKRDKNIKWFESGDVDTIKQAVKNFLNFK